MQYFHFGNAQEQSIPVLKKGFLNISGSYANYQDNRFTPIIFNGLGTTLNLGYNAEYPKNRWGVFLNSRINTLSTASFEVSGNMFNASLNAFYQYKFNERIWLGAIWKILETNVIFFDDLGNNGSPFFYHSNLAFYGTYEREVGRNRRNIGFTLGVGLVSWLRDATSFAYSANQQVLEKGEFNFQNNQSTSPLSFSGGVVRPLGIVNDLQTKLYYDFSSRWRIFYVWEMVNFSVIPKYRTTQANHQLGLRFNFIHHYSADK